MQLIAEAEADRQLEAKLQQIQISKLRGAATNEGGRARSYGKNRIREAGRAEGAIAGQRERLSVASFIAERQAIEDKVLRRGTFFNRKFDYCDVHEGSFQQ